MRTLQNFFFAFLIGLIFATVLALLALLFLYSFLVAI